MTRKLPIKRLRGDQIAHALGYQGGELTVTAVAHLIGCTKRRVLDAVDAYNEETYGPALGYQIVVVGDRLRLETPEEWTARDRLLNADGWGESS